MTTRRPIPRTATILAVASLAAGTLLSFAPAAADEPAPPTTSTISVNVGTFRNQKGVLGCRLFRTAAGFPETSAGTVERRAEITGGTARCEFTNVPPGTYAVSAMHDENDNRNLDKNFLGIPTEGYGVSNNHTHAMSAPTWDESKFVVERGKNVGLGIGLRY
jgi:uncharacterized protein (DUF2141 family)